MSGDQREEHAPAATDTADEETLVLRLEAYEGPIDLLLDQAKAQKVDLKQISILRLVEQYLAFMEQARRRRLELAADYLVMAAWLVYLKSRLLLPEKDVSEEEPSAQELADRLAFQLRRLEAMRSAGEGLLQRPRLGRDVFARGAAVPDTTVVKVCYAVELTDLLKAYADHRARRARSEGSLRIETSGLYSLQMAMQRLQGLLTGAKGWTALGSFLPGPVGDALVDRSAMAATFSAALELTKAGRAELRQDGPFQPVYVRPASTSPKDVGA